MEKTKKYKYKFDDARAIRKSLASIANKVLSGEIEVPKANSVNGLCNTMLGAIRTHEQEQKISELERILEERE